MDAAASFFVVLFPASSDPESSNYSGDILSFFLKSQHTISCRCSTISIARITYTTSSIANMSTDRNNSATRKVPNTHHSHRHPHHHPHSSGTGMHHHGQGNASVSGNLYAPAQDQREQISLSRRLRRTKRRLLLLHLAANQATTEARDQGSMAPSITGDSLRDEAPRLGA